MKYIREHQVEFNAKKWTNITGDILIKLKKHQSDNAYMEISTLYRPCDKFCKRACKYGYLGNFMPIKR